MKISKKIIRASLVRMCWSKIFRLMPARDRLISKPIRVMAAPVIPEMISKNSYIVLGEN